MILTALSLSLAAMVGFVAGWTARDRVETRRKAHVEQLVRQMRANTIKPASFAGHEFPIGKRIEAHREPAQVISMPRRHSLVPMQADEAPDTERSPGQDGAA